MAAYIRQTEADIRQIIDISAFRDYIRQMAANIRQTEADIRQIIDISAFRDYIRQMAAHIRQTEVDIPHSASCIRQPAYYMDRLLQKDYGAWHP